MSSLGLVLRAGQLAAASVASVAPAPVPAAAAASSLAALPDGAHVHDAAGLRSARERASLDGRLADLELRTGPALHLHPSLAQTHDESIYFDDFVIATQRITGR